MLCPRVRPVIERLGPSSVEDGGRLFIKLYHSPLFIPIHDSVKDLGLPGYWGPSQQF